MTSRHHTIGYPAKLIAPVILDGVEVESGYLQPPYQEDVPFTADEETARDAEELVAVEERPERLLWETELKRLQDALAADSITDAELRKLMRMERGLE